MGVMEEGLAVHRWLWYRWLYGPLMKLAHRYHWHYAPPCYPDGDTQLWCRWCGFRQTIKRREHVPIPIRGGCDQAKAVAR